MDTVIFPAVVSMVELVVVLAMALTGAIHAVERGRRIAQVAVMGQY